MGSDVAVPTGANLKVAHEHKGQAERFKAFSHALEAVDDPRCKRPIPRFMLDMPWANEADDIAERIIAKMLSSDDPLTVDDAGGTISGKDLVGKLVTVWDMRVNPSQHQSGWGAYLLCDITVDNNAEHEVMTIGAKEPVAKLAYAWFTGQLPLSGTPMVVTETATGNTVLGFTVEKAF